MLRAADYRERARASLSGNWGMAVLVCFVGALLGGIQSVIPVTANYQYGEGMSVQIFGINYEPESASGRNARNPGCHDEHF